MRPPWWIGMLIAFLGICAAITFLEGCCWKCINYQCPIDKSRAIPGQQPRVPVSDEDKIEEGYAKRYWDHDFPLREYAK